MHCHIILFGGLSGRESYKLIGKEWWNQRTASVNLRNQYRTNLNEGNHQNRELILLTPVGELKCGSDPGEVGGDPGGCCVTQLSYSKNYSGCHVFFIFNFLFNLKTLDKREKIAKNRISQKSKEGFI